MDAGFGDQPKPLHPVAWLGHAVRILEVCAPSRRPWRRRYGLAVAGLVPCFVALATARLAHGGPLRRFAAEVAALDTAFALRTLLGRANEVRDMLDAGDLDGARRLLGAHLVSRDTGDLTPGEVAGAAIESVAENLSDGVIGPWMAYVVGGAPGALAYRTINTLDSMWGYRTSRYADLGFGAARLDDRANILPARVTAAAICAAAATTGHDARAALGTWTRDAGATDSPNAGHPMSAMAGALGVTLTKRDAYRLGDGHEPDADDIGAAIVLARRASLIAGALLWIILLTFEDRS